MTAIPVPPPMPMRDRIKQWGYRALPMLLLVGLMAYSCRDTGYL